MYRQFHDEAAAVYALISVCLVYIEKAEDA